MKRQRLGENTGGITQVTGVEFILFAPFITVVMLCFLLVSVSAILSCRPFFILIFLPCIKMNHYGFSRKSIWKNLETVP